jgi:oligosaccharyltransferase complex subunit epsilon
MAKKASVKPAGESPHSNGNTTITTPSTSSASSSNIRKSTDVQHIVQHVFDNYMDKTPQRVKLIDAFMGFLIVVGALQFVYCVIGGNFVS